MRKERDQKKNKNSGEDQGQEGRHITPPFSLGLSDECAPKTHYTYPKFKWVGRKRVGLT